MRYKHWIGFVLVGLFSSACDEGPQITWPSDGAYAPLKKGMFWLYEVDSTVITANVEKRFQYQLQAEVTDSITEGPGQVWYILSRSKRANATLPFSPLVSWSARTTAQELIIRKGNTAFAALSFPIVTARMWNGNAYNTLGGDEFCAGTGPCDFYKYGDVKLPRVVAGTTFDDVVSVEEGNTPDRLVKYDLRSSYYARGIGLIEQKVEVLSYCTLPACFGKQSVDRGLQYSQRLISYGTR